MAEPKSDRAINAPEENEEAASSQASRTGSQSSDGFIGGPGPAFDAEAAAKEPAPELPGPEQELPLEQWEQEVIESLLSVKGRALHAVAGIAEEDWKYTEIDLAAIAPALTRILNRYPATQAYAPYADPISIFMGLSAYTGRSVAERRAVIAAARAAATEQEIELGGEGAERPEETSRSVPAPPPAPRQPGASPMQPAPGPAPASRPAGERRHREGEADLDPEAAEWQLGTGE